MGDFRVLDEGLVGGIEEDDRVVFLGIIDPFGELGAGCDGTGRVVGEAEINEIGFLIRHAGDEFVFRIARQVEQSGVGTVFIGVSGVACHDVGIDIDWVDRIGDGDDVAFSENVQNVSRVAFRAIGDEHFIGGDAEVDELVVDNRLAEKLVALLRAVAFERGAIALFIDGGMHRLAHGGGERLGHIADPATDDARGFVRVRFRVSFDATCDFRKEVARFEFEEIGIDRCHAGRCRRGRGFGQVRDFGKDAARFD